MKNLRSRVLRRLLKTIQSEENLFQVPRSFHTEERSKTERKRKKSHLRGCLKRPCAWDNIPCLLRLVLGKNHFLLVFQAGLVDRAQFYSLNP